MKVNRALAPISVLLALLLLLTALPALCEQHTEDMQTETFAEGTENRWGYVDAKGGVNLRKKAKTGSALAGKLKNGVMVFIYEAAGDEKGEWLVVDRKGSKAYVLAKYIKVLTEESSLKYNNTLKNPMPTPKPQETLAPADTPKPQETIAAQETEAPTAEPEEQNDEVIETPAPIVDDNSEGDNTDENFGDDAPVNTEAPDDNVLDLSDDGDDSTAVNDDTVDIHEEKTSPDSAPLVISAQLPTEKLDAVALAVLNGLPVRNNPMQYAAITGYLSEGDPVRVTAEVTGEDSKVWYAVSYKGVWGYVASDLLAFVADPAPYSGALASATAEPLDYDTTRDSIFGYVTSASLLMRSEPDAAADNGITRLSKDDLGMIVTADETWAEIITGEYEGYVSVKYFKPYTLAELSNLMSNKDFADKIAAYPVPESVIAE